METEEVMIIVKVGTCEIPAIENELICKDKFVRTVDYQKDIMPETGIKILLLPLSDELYKLKIRPQGIAKLDFYDVTEISGSGKVIRQMGGISRAESTVQDFWAKICEQGRGEEGDLILKGANHFIVRGNIDPEQHWSHNRFVLTASWYKYGDAWCIFASDEINFGCRAGERFFGRSEETPILEPL
jgi:hypothetical protein